MPKAKYMKKIVSVIFLILSINLTMAQQPTLYLIGDSTMADKKDPDSNPEHGWGQLLPELMQNITIENHAVNGRSSKSFITEKRWETVRNKLKSGDFLFIQFGHNDQKFKDSSRYTNPFTGYRYNLKKFVEETREKGATPILMSSIVRRNFNKHGTLEDTHGSYPLVVRLLADELDVPFIDMQWLTEQLETQYGVENSKALHLHYEAGENPYYPEGKTDDTHLSEKGARLVASLALQEIAKKDPELKKYINPAIIEQELLR